jgi:ATP-binding cassette subfamily B protein
MKNKKSFKGLKRVLENNLFLLSIAFKAAPLTTVWLLTHTVISSIVVFFEHTYQIVYLIDCIQYQKPFIFALRFVILIFCIVTTRIIFTNILDSKVVPKGVEKINRALRFKLYEQAKAMDIACYDNPAFYNDYVFAMGNVTERTKAVIGTAGQIINGIVIVFLLGSYITMTDWTSFIFVAVSLVLTLLFQTSSNKIRFSLDKALNPILRKRDYINRVFYLPDYVKEIRMGRVKEVLYEDYAESERSVYGELKKRTRKIAVFEFLREYLVESFIFDFAFLLYLMFQTIVLKTLSFGELYGLNRSAERMKNTINSFSNLAQLQEHSLYIEKVRAFLDYKQKVVSKPDAISINHMDGTIEFLNVSFTYPSASEPTLSDVTMTIHRGEKIAIVGFNGAGKTTLVKLLMRLYDPGSGDIRYAGESIKNYDLSDYRLLFSTLFQDYQIYAATVKQNIIADDESDIMISEQRIDNALVSAGFNERVLIMQNGTDTQLTKEFTQGEELSGGERQKLAISRCMYKDSPFVILDEPSSALDPIAEYELNNMMLNLGRDKTVIFISHRLSTTKMADRIYMFEKGRLIEQGSHAELMRLNEKYAKMFTLQAEKYR